MQCFRPQMGECKFTYALSEQYSFFSGQNNFSIAQDSRLNGRHSVEVMSDDVIRRSIIKKKKRDQFGKTLNL